MPETFKISIDFSHLLPVYGAITEASFPHLSRAVQVIAEQAQSRWVEYAHGRALPSGMVIHNRTGEYARSIQLKQTGPFSAEVFSVLPYAEAIERGSPARDLKAMLNSSMKVRVTKDGRRYLIIPFRWSTPGAVSVGPSNVMPKEVYNWWRGVPAGGDSRVTGSYRRISGTGALDIKTRAPITVPGWRYKWGTRASHDDLAALGLNDKQAKRMAGMVRFRTTKGYGAGSFGKYITFRMMVEGSKGWIAKAQPGRYPAKTVADELRPLAEVAFTKAVEFDIKAILGGGS
jgi:hypothetical protein